MAFAVRNRSVLAYANGFTLWHYKAGLDSRGDTNRTGFFAPAGDMLTAGDMVMVSAKDGAQLVCLLEEAGAIRTAPVT